MKDYDELGISWELSAREFCAELTAMQERLIAQSHNEEESRQLLTYETLLLILDALEVFSNEADYEEYRVLRQQAIKEASAAEATRLRQEQEQREKAAQQAAAEDTRLRQEQEQREADEQRAAKTERGRRKRQEQLQKKALQLKKRKKMVAWLGLCSAVCTIVLLFLVWGWPSLQAIQIERHNAQVQSNLNQCSEWFGYRFEGTEVVLYRASPAGGDQPLRLERLEQTYDSIHEVCVAESRDGAEPASLVGALSGGYYLLEKDDRFALWSKTGQQLTEFVYAEFRAVGPSVFLSQVLLRQGEKWHCPVTTYDSETGLYALDAQRSRFFDELKPIGELLAARMGDQWGLLSRGEHIGRQDGGILLNEFIYDDIFLYTQQVEDYHAFYEITRKELSTPVGMRQGAMHLLYYPEIAPIEGCEEFYFLDYPGTGDIEDYFTWRGVPVTEQYFVSNQLSFRGEGLMAVRGKGTLRLLDLHLGRELNEVTERIGAPISDIISTGETLFFVTQGQEIFSCPLDQAESGEPNPRRLYQTQQAKTIRLIVAEQPRHALLAYGVDGVGGWHLDTWLNAARNLKPVSHVPEQYGDAYLQTQNGKIGICLGEHSREAGCMPQYIYDDADIIVDRYVAVFLKRGDRWGALLDRDRSTHGYEQRLDFNYETLEQVKQAADLLLLSA